MYSPKEIGLGWPFAFRAPPLQSLEELQVALWEVGRICCGANAESGIGAGSSALSAPLSHQPPFRKPHGLIDYARLRVGEQLTVTGRVYGICLWYGIILSCCILLPYGMLSPYGIRLPYAIRFTIWYPCYRMVSVYRMLSVYQMIPLYRVWYHMLVPYQDETRRARRSILVFSQLDGEVFICRHLVFAYR